MDVKIFRSLINVSSRHSRLIIIHTEYILRIYYRVVLYFVIDNDHLIIYARYMYPTSKNISMHTVMLSQMNI